MSNLMTLSEELDEAASFIAAQNHGNAENFYPRAVNILRAKAAALRNEHRPKPKRKTVVGYVGSRHTKIKVQGLFEEENTKE